MSTRDDLTQERLKQVLHYDPETGNFTRLISGHKRLIGKIVGTPRADDGYIKIIVDGHGYYAHRLAFLYMTGKFPEHDTDHINTDGSDNRWTNLRTATRSQNLGNVKVKRNSVTGIKGVGIHHTGRFYARIRLRGVGINLGVFDTAELASAAYAKAANEQFGHFARVA